MITVGNSNPHLNESKTIKEMDAKEATKAIKDSTYMVGQVSSLLSFLESYASSHPDFKKDIDQYIIQSRKAVEVCSIHGTRAKERLMELERSK